MPAKLFKVLPFLSIMSLFVLLFGVVSPARTEAPAVQVDIDPQYLPGKPVPASYGCSWGRLSDGEVFCETSGNADSMISFTFDIRRRVITCTTFTLRATTIGELVLVWGSPTGYSQSGGGAVVYWDYRSAYVLVSEFGPTEPVVLVSYELDHNQPKFPWKGFVIHAR